MFTKSYGQKILLQTAIGARLSGVVNFVRKFDWSSLNWREFTRIKIVRIVPIDLIFRGKNYGY